MSIFIDAHVAYLRAAGYSPRTIYGRTRILCRLDEDLPGGLVQPNRGELAAWFAPWKGWTLYTYWEAANTFYTWACAGRDPYLSYNPMQDLKRPRTPRNEPRPATDEQIALALARLADPWRTGVLIANLQGLRCAEICRLDREHVTADHIWVDRKGGTTQLLPTHPVVWRALADRPPGPIVRMASGERFRPAYYSGGASTALNEAGLIGITLHRFRASFATRLHEGGTPIKVIQDLMGHASVVSTQGYIKVKDEQRRLAISTLLVPTGTLQDAA
jgi:integrase